MENNGFSNWERVFAAIENNAILGFCALSETSAVFDNLYMPYINFLFVGERYRGKRIGEKLIKTVIEYAKAIGFDKTYLYSDLTNFYEKYGFVKIAEKEAPWGTMQAIYMHVIK